MIIAIDSHIFIWGIKKEAQPYQKHMIGQAEDFFNWADDSGHAILIPSLVIAEILSGEPEEKHAEYLQIINDSFIIGDFNVMAARKCATLLRDKAQDIKDYRDLNQVRKEKMKFDYGIISTALVYNATCIYSYDPDVIKFGNGFIDVRELPKVGRQSQMFAE